MIKIAHRGNINGCQPAVENSPEYIQAALDLGYHVEIDVRLVDGLLYLGHDEPKYLTSINFLQNERLWCHAKNSAALQYFTQAKHVHYFWHDSDDYTLTSKGYPWVYPGRPLFPGAIAVKPEGFYNEKDLEVCFGICSDFIANFK